MGSGQYSILTFGAWGTGLGLWGSAVSSNPNSRRGAFSANKDLNMTRSYYVRLITIFRHTGVRGPPAPPYPAIHRPSFKQRYGQSPCPDRTSSTSPTLSTDLWLRYFSTTSPAERCDWPIILGPNAFVFFLPRAQRSPPAIQALLPGHSRAQRQIAALVCSSCLLFSTFDIGEFVADPHQYRQIPVLVQIASVRALPHQCGGTFSRVNVECPLYVNLAVVELVACFADKLDLVRHLYSCVPDSRRQAHRCQSRQSTI